MNVVLQLYRVLFGDKTRERIRLKRDADELPAFSDVLHKHLPDIPGLTDTETSLGGHLPGASTSLLDALFTAGRIPTDGIIYRLIRDNPKLLLNPEIRRLVIRMLEAAGRSQMDSFLETYDLHKIVALLEVNCQKHVQWLV